MIKYKNKKLLIVITSIIVVIISSVNLILRQNYVNSYSDFGDKDALIYGRIASEYAYTTNGNIKIFVDEIKIEWENK